MSSPSGLSTTADKALVATVIVAGIAAAVVVIVTGHATPDLLGWLSGPVATFVAGLVLAKRQAKLAETTKQIADQTNGPLTASLDSLQDKGSQSLEILQRQDKASA